MWRAHIDPMPSTDCRSFALAASSPCSDPNDRTSRSTWANCRSGNACHRPVPARAHCRILRLCRRRIAENPCQRGEVEQLGIRKAVELLERGGHLRRGRRIRVGVVVAHDQLACDVVVADQLLQLKFQLASVGAEFDDIGVDFEADPADHLQPLHHRHHVAQRDEILDLCRRQLPAHLIEARLVPLQGVDGLVGARQDGRRIGHHMSLARHVDGHDAHRMAHRHNGISGLNRRALGGPVPGARLVGRNRRVGHQLNVGPQDAVAVAGQNDGPVHLGQLAQPGRRVCDVE